ncbi:MAG TPA: DinB family protein [Candidatus Koribacter sp.]
MAMELTLVVGGHSIWPPQKLGRTLGSGVIRSLMDGVEKGRKMIGKLVRSLKRLERDRESFFEELRALSAKELHFRAAEKSWSPLEVLDHLVRMEKLIAAQLAQNRGSTRKILLKDRLRNLAVRGVMRSSMRVTTPKGAEASLPGDEKPLEMVLTEWAAQRQVLKLVLASFAAEDTRYGTFRHPVGGWMTANGSLKFIDSHVVHHRLQVKRAVRMAQSGAKPAMYREKKAG